MDQDSLTRRAKEQAAWKDESLLATPLVVMFIDRYGVEGLSWDPQTVVLEVEDDYKVALSRGTQDRLLAGIALLSTDLFYNSMADFIHLCNVLSGSPFDPGVFDPADAVECAWGITEAMLLSPPEEGNDEPFHPDIVEYLKQVVRLEGILNPPDILRLAGGPELLDAASYTWSDDPEAFAAIAGVAKDKAADIETAVAQRTLLLFQQLLHLPLAHGSVEALRKRLVNHPIVGKALQQK